VEKRLCYIISSVDSGLHDNKWRYFGFPAAFGKVASQKCALTFKDTSNALPKKIVIGQLTEKNKDAKKKKFSVHSVSSITIMVKVDLTLSKLRRFQVTISLSLSIVSALTVAIMS